jgi:hypothetical protein
MPTHDDRILHRPLLHLCVCVCVCVCLGGCLWVFVWVGGWVRREGDGGGGLCVFVCVCLCVSSWISHYNIRACVWGGGGRGVFECVVCVCVCVRVCVCARARILRLQRQITRIVRAVSTASCSESMTSRASNVPLIFTTRISQPAATTTIEPV